MACSLFEASDWISSDATALSMAAVVKTLPDNKIVEDVHQAVRLEATPMPIREVENWCHPAMCHELSHLQQPQFVYPAKLSKEVFSKNWGKKVSSPSFKKSFHAKYHRAPEIFGNIFKKKTWTLFEEQYGKSHAAWQWVCHFTNCQMGHSGYQDEDTCLGYCNV